MMAVQNDQTPKETLNELTARKDKAFAAETDSVAAETDSVAAKRTVLQRNGQC
jgi:hypothetical protein